MSPVTADLSTEHLFAAIRGAGLRPQVLEPVLFLSVPRSAAISIGEQRLGAWPATFSRSTGSDPVEGKLQLSDPNAGDELGGVIAVVEAPLVPDVVYALERRGAVGQIFVQPHEVVRPRTCSTIWGAPTHESISRKPRTPVVIVASPQRDLLAEAARAGARARISSQLEEGWTRAQVLVAEIHGAHDPDEFVLVHGSDDDALVTLAKECHAIRGELTRSVRFAWWPDRRLGSAAGSTWYADAFAAEIDEWCAAHVSVGGEPDGDAYWMAEAAELCLESIAKGGEAVPRSRRPPREADYSFNQVGVTGLFGGHAYPSSVYAHAVIHIAKAVVYPFDYTAPLLEMGAAVQRYQAAAGNEIDLGGVSQDLARLRRAISAWRSDADTELHRHQADTALRRRVNATMRSLARVLVPLGFSRGERFDHDPALRFSALPRLEAALHVAAANQPMRPFVRTALVREINKVRARVRDALALLSVLT
ncbi:MAG: hypothetical protein ACM36C_00015 [Acidobacteriota bacterium]